MTASPEWETESLLSDEQLREILSQSFSFLGKGAQVYAFESQDGQYVLKLFRFDQRKRFIGPKLTSDAKIRSFFNACKIGWEMAREETALVYLHLNPTSGKLPVLSIRTPTFRRIHLPLDPYRFAIQKKVVPLEEALTAALAEGLLGERIDAILSLIEHRAAKGIGNRDPSLWRNFGFLGAHAIELDFGNYVIRSDFQEKSARLAELERYARPLRRWLEKNAPEIRTSAKSLRESGENT